ncbi:type I toxin-antitoxin system Ibs family toxin [Escherichia coli]|nr:type I toxin-antitoxin system Ibs family toxin [Escherichia coli]
MMKLVIILIVLLVSFATY